VGRDVRLNCHADGGGSRSTYQVDDARRSLLVADEEKTLSGVGGPSNVMVGSLGRLLGSEVVGERLGLDGVVAEEEEFLAGNEVPVGRGRLAHG
jgi:hypothetical protein